jgi:acetoacetate decarboxylase
MMPRATWGVNAGPLTPGDAGAIVQFPVQPQTIEGDRLVGVAGRLSKDKFGYSMPVDAPLYEPFPLYYQDARILMFPYLTPASKAAALVPSSLELITVDAEGTLALAELIVAHYPFSNIGAYNEVAQTLAVTYKGSAGAYAVRLHVTNDQAMAAGREIGGFPKKMGEIAFEEGAVFTGTLDAPAGLRICSAEMAPLQPIPWLTDLPVTYYSLRVIPNPIDKSTPSLAQLIQSTWVLEGGTFWSARGMAAFTGASALNPYHALPIVQLLPPIDPDAQSAADRRKPGLSFFRGSMRVEKVSIVEEY